MHHMVLILAAIVGSICIVLSQPSLLSYVKYMYIYTVQYRYVHVYSTGTHMYTEVHMPKSGISPTRQLDIQV